MKKLKMFLLLSILICFGFILTSEVHAQGDSPKILEIGDVLPAGEIKLSWDFTERDLPIGGGAIIVIRDANGGLFIRIDLSTEEFRLMIFTLGNKFYNLTDEVIITLETDLIVTSIPNGSDEYYEYIDGFIFWEIVPSGYSITFEENGGSEVTDLTEQTALPNPLPTPTIENNTYFLGWYYDSDFTNRAFPGDPLTADVTLYAKWGLINSPKIFEVGDVLPAEIIKMRVSLYNSGDFYEPQTAIYFNDTNWIAFEGVEDDGYDVTPYVDINTNLSSNYIIIDDSNVYYEGTRDENMYAEIIIDFSNCSLSERTVSSIDVDSTHGGINPTWEVVSTGPKVFEVGDELPAGYIKISWDFTDKPVDVLHIFSILGDSEGDEVLNIEISSYGDSGSIIIIFINDNEFFVNEPGGTILTLTEPITIHSVEGYETYDYEPLDYYEYIDDALLWEVVSQDYTDGYEDGYAYAGVSYELGREHAREIYGYYDPITEQWLSVEEYLDLYGTDKPGQSDFYKNFDKYFIPAMIIVFGGAIVLTILKVFKGRE